ncbi:Bug family tripartite tricarboxylate transporter substrate binding protein [Allopusillimonas ginsengisoli]|uniref:Bug family tripartite tricarboxylate transporter substrate binding protein n=1 Tax=Allopusillimonas ginsengisoli TaxID=453575 RepID=UPI00101F23A1|nr:tripartite tricarboxylate transporter substrate binding protein [Allopusillimonas ginsengisoli]TEA70394.1 tripartite tricarboxylate transporter substrate binding protein [Allopusillimonas ginsengisoli]
MVNARSLRALAIALSLLCATSAVAAKYPERPLKLVVPYPPGGASDGIARQVAQRLAVKIGQPVVVENKSGAGGAIGADSVAKSSPDGYTLLLGSASELSIVPTVRAVPYNPTTDFVPIMLVAKFPMVLVANTGLPVTDLQSFIQHAKKEAEANRFEYASIGVGTTTHIAAEYFRLTTGIPPMNNIPYKGGSPALQDVMAGHTPFMFDTLVSSIGQIKAGTVKALGITSTERWESLPEIPTIAESGYPGFEFGGWSGILAPAGTKPEIVEILSTALTEVMNDPAVEQSIVQVGANMAGGTANEFKSFILSEIDKNGLIVKQANIKAD